MDSVIRNSTYKNTISFLSIFSFVCALGCVLLGYLFMPLAAAFYSTLLIYENPRKRFFSLSIPIAVFIINIVLNGLFSLEGIGYVLISLIVAKFYKSGKSKSECAFWLSLVTLLLFLISIIIFPINKTGIVSFEIIPQYYRALFIEQKSNFVRFFTSYTTVDKNGDLFFVINPTDAALMFNELLYILIPGIIITSFLLSGVTLKIFSSKVLRYSGVESGIDTWQFGTSKFLAGFYLILSILNFFASQGQTTLDFLISSVYMILLAVFAYIGVRFFYQIFSRQRKLFTTMVLLIGIILFSSFAFQLLSYFGVFYVFQSASYINETDNTAK